MTKDNKHQIAIEYAADAGIDASHLNTRALNILTRIQEAITALEQKRENLREGIAGTAINVSTIANMTGISRSALQTNPVFNGVVRAHAFPSGEEKYISRTQYEAVLQELKTLREWFSKKAEQDAKMMMLQRDNEMFRNRIKILEDRERERAKEFIQQEEVIRQMAGAGTPVNTNFDSPGDPFKS